MFTGEHGRAETYAGQPVLKAQPSIICIFLVNVKVIFYKTMHMEKKGAFDCLAGKWEQQQQELDRLEHGW